MPALALLDPPPPVVAWRARAPMVITVASLLPAALAAVAIAEGALRLGGVLYLIAGACDALDGALARRFGVTSRRGALLDSVVDRLVDGLALGALALLLRSALAMAALIFALVVPYVNARAASLRLATAPGIAPRALRVFVVGLCLGLNAPIFAVRVIVALALATFGERMVEALWSDA